MPMMELKEIVRRAEQVLSVSWKAVYERRITELEEMFKAYGDRAYGAWIQDFMSPVAAHFSQEGITLKSGFQLKNSIENWGPPEERERCIWYTLSANDGAPIGSLMLQVYHSHRAFHIPRPPRLLELETVEREEILSLLSRASTRVRWDRKEERLPPAEGQWSGAVKWEYASDVSLGDCLNGTEGDHSSWALDEALSHWGRYGWELVSVVPSGAKTIAYFKRPYQDSCLP
ncbi:hypothetical protein PM3016_3333 [Paenibacillus mucilaginosus 3016]|uniref:Uncharacterized protein n=1 Tax=Paenibacillus mucilaginosus 3016 TaxID=1116391 RepID=H6NHV7_9BACL|nr:DUF6022 family protein [Paenibacillus mucilaginosus]AFC30178.1 hypothetical protein PM3016_3333 [Paenibacillus mucilaginosus 3016]WFA18826.1 hypothetical protein ERY13_16835 [Paenibacillus mucilaginosus]